MIRTLNDIKRRLDIPQKDKQKADLVMSYLKEVEERVKNYCNRNNIPEGLYYTVVSMVVELYQYRNNGIVITEKQGNRSITYGGKNDIDNVLSSHIPQLNRFRRIKVI